MTGHALLEQDLASLEDYSRSVQERWAGAWVDSSQQPPCLVVAVTDDVSAHVQSLPRLHHHVDVVQVRYSKLELLDVLKAVRKHKAWDKRVTAASVDFPRNAVFVVASEPIPELERAHGDRVQIEVWRFAYAPGLVDGGHAETDD